MTTWLLIDVGIMMTCLYAGYVVFVLPTGWPYPHVELWQAWIICSGALIASSLIFGLNDRATLLSRSKILTRIILTATAAAILTYAVVYVLMYTTMSRRVAGCAIGGYLLCATTVRLLACWTLNRVKRGLLLVGSRSLWDSFMHSIEEGHLSRYKLVGYVHTGLADGTVNTDAHCLGTAEDMVGLCHEHRVSDVVVGAEATEDPRMSRWMLAGLYHGCRVTNEPTFYEKATGQILVDRITPDWFLSADLETHCEEQSTAKRAVDLLLAVSGLIVTVPLWPIIALLIKLTDFGPVFYSQDRVGQHGRVFRLHKFRTMRVNAENGTAQWATKNDPRVTWAGRILRRSRLDELPQLYNILMGSMSVVGPRPERPGFVVQLARQLPFYTERHLVKPGLTGWAQIGFKYGNTVEDAKRKLQFDLYYLKHMCFELDVIILFRTLGTFLRGAC
ncbi:MAG: sugar transferase [Planctomycetes bacterium]|nr:sugar transferase [Planctomycetota bacterium]